MDELSRQIQDAKDRIAMRKNSNAERHRGNEGSQRHRRDTNNVQADGEPGSTVEAITFGLGNASLFDGFLASAAAQHLMPADWQDLLAGNPDMGSSSTTVGRNCSALWAAC
eukprot:gene2348-2655_t